MEKIIKNKINLITCIYFCLLEIIFRIYTKEKIVSSGFIFALFFNLLLGNLIYFLIVCISKKDIIRKTSLILFSGIISLFYFAQMVYFKIFKTFFTIYLMTHGLKAFSFWKEMLLYMSQIIFWLIGIILLFAIYVYYIVKKSNFDNNINKIKIFCQIVITFMITIITAILPINKYGSPQNVFLHYNSIDSYFEGLGLPCGILYDLKNNFFVKKQDKEKIYKIINDYRKKLVENNEKSFINAKNDKTAIFKNKNLVFVCAESFSPYAIDKNLTPTLYKMANDSFVFKNYYSPLWQGSTSDGEYSALTSLIPKYTGMTIVDTINNNMPYTIANILKNNKYNNFAFHNNDAYYYRRNETYTNFGYNFYGNGLGLEFEKFWPESDEELIDKTFDFYLKKDDNGNIPNFNVFYMTMSGHLSYNYLTNQMAIRHKKLIDSFDKYKNLPTSSKAYLSANYEVEIFMTKLLKYLNDNNILDDTVICLVPDHFPYGLTDKEYDALARENLSDSIEKYKSCMILYNSQIKKEVVSKYCSSIDILPTLLNLFGVEYDETLFMGNDIFSDKPQLVLFKDKSFISDKLKYNYKINEYEVATGVEDLELNKYIEYMNKKNEEKFLISKYIVDYNYYDYLKNNK